MLGTGEINSSYPADHGFELMRLILVRHGQTDWNTEYRAQGQKDIPLNDIGLAQAGAIAQALSLEPIEAIYSSPSSRTSVGH